jgi:hypothetical protein
MPKRKTSVIATALTYAEAVALSAADRIDRFKFEAGAGQRAFAAMAKLFRATERSLAPGQAIFPLLIGAGIKKGTVSNASIAARIYDLVEAGHLEESEFDRLTFNECWQLKRVLSGKSKKTLPVADAVAMIRNNEDFAEDFASLYETGLTTLEAAAKATKPEAEADAPAEETPAPAAVEDAKPKVAEPPAPEAVEPAKPAPAPALPTAEQLIAMLEQVELAMAELPADAQGIIGAKLVEMATAFVDSGKAVKPRSRKKLAAA